MLHFIIYIWDIKVATRILEPWCTACYAKNRGTLQGVLRKTPKIGIIAEFDATLEDWPTFVDRLELYCAANGIIYDQKKACLLTQMGEQTYGLLQSLVAPTKPENKWYEEIVGVLRTYLVPKRLVIGERFRTYKRDQLPNENISDYVA